MECFKKSRTQACRLWLVQVKKKSQNPSHVTRVPQPFKHNYQGWTQGTTWNYGYWTKWWWQKVCLHTLTQPSKIYPVHPLQTTFETQDWHLLASEGNIQAWKKTPIPFQIPDLDTPVHSLQRRLGALRGLKRWYEDSARREILQLVLNSGWQILCDCFAGFRWQRVIFDTAKLIKSRTGRYCPHGYMFATVGMDCHRTRI